MTGRLVLIEWKDARGVSAEWADFKYMDYGLCTVRSVGWVLAENDEFIQIVPHIGHDPDQGCGDMTIPKVAVMTLTDLLEGANA